MNKTNFEKLTSLKKANKTVRERMAGNAGFKTYAAYRIYLENGEKEDKPTIHIVNILDVSGSMEGDKFNNALTGIFKETKEFKNSDEINYLTTLYTFSWYSEILEHFFKKPVGIISLKPILRCSGMTALYDAIGKVLIKTKNLHSVNEKVLVNIFTDGEENNSKIWNAPKVKNLIKECKELGFTITFVGTGYDVNRMKKVLDIDDSNTLVHDNTGESVEKAFKTRSAATKNFSEKVLKGEDTLLGFYKSTNETL